MEDYSARDYIQELCAFLSEIMTRDNLKKCSSRTLGKGSIEINNQRNEINLLYYAGTDLSVRIAIKEGKARISLIGDLNFREGYRPFFNNGKITGQDRTISLDGILEPITKEIESFLN
jgi:hypothetical protein